MADLIKGQRFKGILMAGEGVILQRNDYKRANGEMLEAYDVAFDGDNKIHRKWWRAHIAKTEPKWRTRLRNYMRGLNTMYSFACSFQSIPTREKLS